MPPNEHCAELQSPGHSAHIGQDIEVHYRWHAHYGRRVRRQYVGRRAGGAVVHVEVAPGIVIGVAAWMLDPAACAGMALECSTLDRRAEGDFEKVALSGRA